jgi:two-component system sensor histidine kinase QseC
MILSIRTRLLLWMLGGMTVLLTVSALAVYGAMRRSLKNGFDAVLLSTARAVADSVEPGHGRIKVEIDEHDLPEFTRSVRPDFFQIWSGSGEVLGRSPSLGDLDLGWFASSAGKPEFRAISLPDGREGRAVSLRFQAGGDDEPKGVPPFGEVTLVVARDTAALDSDLGVLGMLLLLTTGGTLLLTLIVGGFVVHQGLRPLQALAARIASIRPDELAIPMGAGRMPAELRPVVEKLDDLLRRLEAAFRRERAFAADVTHELRTPLAGMRSTLEVSLGHLRGAEDYRQDMEECLEILKRMQAMIGSLTTLERLEAGQVAMRFETIPLAEFVDGILPPFADEARARGIGVDCRIPRDLQCRADRECLALILTNLLANAAEYTDDAGRIEIVAGRDGESITLQVANSGCRLDAAEAKHVFERFWRGDASRTGTGTHSGLGLALVRRAAAALSGTVSVAVAGDTYSIRLQLIGQGAKP